MAYVLIEGYMCERCNYRWGCRTGSGVRSNRDPRVCPHCKSPYWNKPRRKNIAPERQATPWHRNPRETYGTSA
jgi:hypothetical protein